MQRMPNLRQTPQGIWPFQYQPSIDPWQREDFRAYRRR